MKLISIYPSKEKGVNFYKLKNKNGASVTVTNYGATITSIKMPDKEGKLTEVALGYDDITQYTGGKNNYFGSTVGRFANRIAGGRFKLNGKDYQISQNESDNTLHGGSEGFSAKIWEARPLEDKVVFELVSPDNDQGFPGEVDAKVTFELTDDNEIIIKYEAVTSEDTIINLTNHSYFNLNGGSRDVLNHIVKIEADGITETDGELIPTGKIVPVENTPYDLNEPKVLEDIIGKELERGYDINYALSGVGEREIASIKSPLTGIKMTVKTDQPGAQFYTAGSLAEGVKGHDGNVYGPFYGVCVETQNFPDAINHPNFPPCVLRADDMYKTVTTYKFETE